MAVDLTSLEISLLLPSSDGPIDFESLNCNAVGTEITLVPDSELHPVNETQVVEIMGSNTKLILYPDCARPLLVMHLRSMKRFMAFKITCQDSTGKRKSFLISNKLSFVTVEDDECQTPLQIGQGWQLACIDLEDMMANAFGVSYERCIEIEICGSCRVAKVYFQSKKYSDIELPDYLRVVCQ